MRRPIIKALLVGIIFVVIYYVIKSIRGVYLTTNYVPDIVDTYESVNYMQHIVTFGYLPNPMWIAIEFLIVMLLGILVYYIGKALKMRF